MELSREIHIDILTKKYFIEESWAKLNTRGYSNNKITWATTPSNIASLVFELHDELVETSELNEQLRESNSILRTVIYSLLLGIVFSIVGLVIYI